jgi:sec-independent protein translocase protein TatB
MFEVGFTEIILILGIALLVLGPEKLPKLAGQIGRWLGRARAMARQLKSQLDEEVNIVDKPWSQPAPQSTPPPPGTAPEPAADEHSPADSEPAAADAGETVSAETSDPNKPPP